ncbi:hypothetical protein CBL_12028 [Carabus blaptoides fortunei]
MNSYMETAPGYYTQNYCKSEERRLKTRTGKDGKETKVRWTDEELSIVAEEEARSRTLGLKPNWRKISALTHRTEEALKSQRRSVRYKATLLKVSTSIEPDKEAPPSLEPPPTPPTVPYSSPGALNDTPSEDTLLRREIITTIQALVATHTDINPTIRSLCAIGLNAKGSTIRTRLAAALPDIFPEAKKRKRHRSKPAPQQAPCSRKEWKRRHYNRVQRDWAETPAEPSGKS